jgi:hypothetical protein
MPDPALTVGMLAFQVLAFYDLEGMNKWSQLLYEFLFFIGFFVLAWAALALKRHQRR